MWVIDELTKDRISMRDAKEVLIRVVDNTYIYGFVSRGTRGTDLHIYDPSQGGFWGTEVPQGIDLGVELLYNKKDGFYYICLGEMPADLKWRLDNELGYGGFPYTFRKRYEAIESFDIFKGKQQILAFNNYPHHHVLGYTFGFEFETSAGYIPEDICFRDGLIPLRDGSITGLEYSTVVLKGNDGLNLLHQQLQTLKKYTSFNFDCSVHIHIGGFKNTPETLYNLYVLGLKLEPLIADLVPDLTFRSAEYKSNKKDYCKRLPSQINSFDELYSQLTGQKFLGSLTQAHPADIKRQQKWNIHTRYYWLNFINAICYPVNKTIEFRFLRPTYSFEKLYTWLLIFTAMMKFAEQGLVCDRRISSWDTLIDKVFPLSTAAYLKVQIQKLRAVHKLQTLNKDFCGSDILAEQQFFSWD